ncbi:MAG: Na+/H+ antiporter subunit E [Candidatus Aenigmarchaeota archaeon]|nr:Na+/H+ antiporter subunit E [Candidatus Aenigmarchaeota archaeon]
MPKILFSFLLTFAFWIVLAGTAIQEIIIGIIIASTVTITTKEFLFRESPKTLLSPLFWLGCVRYIIVFIKEEIIANIKTVSIILTGNINPAIVKLSTTITGDTKKALLADSITLTPGTFTLEIKDALFIHCLNHKKDSSPGAVFEKTIRGIK